MKGLYMYIEKNGLGCTLYSENIRDKQILRVILPLARSRNISFGGVALFVCEWLLVKLDESLAKDEEELLAIRKENERRLKVLTENAEMIPYVWFRELEPEDLEKFLASVSIDSSQIRITGLNDPRLF